MTPPEAPPSIETQQASLAGPPGSATSDVRLLREDKVWHVWVDGQHVEECCDFTFDRAVDQVKVRMASTRRNFDYPTQTEGSRIARQVRSEANALTESARASLFKQGMHVIYGGTGVMLRAQGNLEKWDEQDFETLGLAIAEETGELCQAILKARREGGSPERIRQEAIDLGALCVQVLAHWSNDQAQR